MPNYRLTLEYNGTNFNGSQRQAIESKTRTVQGELEKVLGDCLKDEINTIFSGRTDRGVHALDQVVNFHTKKAINDDLDKALMRINATLPEDMVVVKIKEVDEDFHARFDAKSREYLYKLFIRPQRPVLRLDSLAWYKQDLDFESMQDHAKTFLGTQDFAAYAKEENIEIDSDSTEFQVERTTICEVQEIELIRESKLCFKFRIKANRFLRNMVRRIVGELVHVGKGNEPSEKTKAFSAPAAGLTLIKVEY